MIQARGLTKSYGQGGVQVSALRGVDIDIRKGEFVCIMGPSGSGKSTLLQLLGALDRPTGGEIRFQDKPLTKMSANELADLRRRSMGFVFQAFNLIPTFTAAENVALPLMLERESLKSAMPKVMEVLDLVGLSHRHKHRPNEMSGGEMQRVAVARALVNRPSVLFADEPTGNLDSKNGEQVMRLLLDCQQQMAITIVMVTHDPKVADYSNRVVTLVDGMVAKERQVNA